MYIKKNRLVDEKNKYLIRTDETLKPIFGGKTTVKVFEFPKLVSKHLKDSDLGDFEEADESQAGLRALADLFRNI